MDLWVWWCVSSPSPLCCLTPRNVKMTLSEMLISQCFFVHLHKVSFSERPHQARLIVLLQWPRKGVYRFLLNRCFLRQHSVVQSIWFNLPGWFDNREEIQPISGFSCLLSPWQGAIRDGSTAEYRRLGWIAHFVCNFTCIIVFSCEKFTAFFKGVSVCT